MEKCASKTSFYFRWIILSYILEDTTLLDLILFIFILTIYVSRT
jgi:hypothetical protein